MGLTSIDRVRILFVVNSLKRRGAEQQLFSFVKALPDRFNISIFNFSNDSEEYPEFRHSSKYKIYSGKHKGTYNILRYRPLINCLSREKFDIVVTIGLGAALFFGRICAALKGVRVIYSTLNTFENFHNLPKLGQYFDIFNMMLNNILNGQHKKRIYRFLPNSDGLSEKIRGNVKKYNVRTLHNGLPIEDFKLLLDYVPSNSMRQILKRINGVPSIAQIGILDHNKNHIFALECLLEIKKRQRDVHLLMIGDGPDRTMLSRWVYEHKLDSNVIFTGQLDRTETLYLMSKARLVILTSKSESFPNVILEAQALALPVVSCDVGAVSEIVLNCETGFIINNFNIADFVKATIAILNNKDLACNMGQKAKERAWALFGMHRKVYNFLEMVKEDLEQINGN